MNQFGRVAAYATTRLTIVHSGEQIINVINIKLQGKTAKKTVY